MCWRPRGSCCSTRRRRHCSARCCWPRATTPARRPPSRRCPLSMRRRRRSRHCLRAAQRRRCLRSRLRRASRGCGRAQPSSWPSRGSATTATPRSPRRRMRRPHRWQRAAAGHPRVGGCGWMMRGICWGRCRRSPMSFWSKGGHFPLPARHSPRPRRSPRPAGPSLPPTTPRPQRSDRCALSSTCSTWDQHLSRFARRPSGFLRRASDLCTW